VESCGSWHAAGAKTAHRAGLASLAMVAAEHRSSKAPRVTDRPSNAAVPVPLRKLEGSQEAPRATDPRDEAPEPLGHAAPSHHRPEPPTLATL
jgi:hypothetical protein